MRRLRAGLSPSATELIEDQARGSVDVSRADREHEVAWPRPSRDEARAVLEQRRPARREAGPCFRQRVDDQLPGDTLDRLLAGRVDVRDSDHVRGGEFASELRGDVPRTRVEVGLEEDEHSAVRALPGRRDY